MIIVKVAVVGSRTEEVTLNDGAKVSEALQIAGKSADNLDIRIDGNAATTNTTLKNGDIIHLVARAKGGC